MVTQISGISDKSKLMEHLYKNPKKLAMRLARFLSSSNNELLPLARIKGAGQGFYYSISHKSLVRVSRTDEFYLLPDREGQEAGYLYLYTHYICKVGCIIRVAKEEVELLGFN